MVATRRLSELVAGALDGLDVPSGPVTVALSGGADSAALALLVTEAGVESSCLHIDHGLPASPMMSKAADAVAAHLGLDIETVEVTLPSGASPEAVARGVRYEVFIAVPGPLLTAHTRDDNAETVVINLVRGTGSRGLAGIPPFRPPNIHRPLLGVTRSDTREMASLAGLPFGDDPMNDDLTLTRNRVRRTILPLLAEMNPQIVETLARSGELLSRDAVYIDSQVPKPKGPEVATGLVRALPRPLADRLLSDLLRTVGMSVTSDRLERVWEVVRGESRQHDLADGKTVSRRGALVVIE